ncbi:MAG TPA: group 1 truncated hemoglobin [Polyangiales bacterium]
MTYFEQIGGEAALRAIIDEFVERVFADIMIGFFFERASKERVKRFEYEHAAEFLGAPITYGGRDLAEAHAKHRIMGGQFARRRRILETTLEKHGVPAAIREAWLAYQDGLREQVTHDPVGQCIERPKDQR